MVIKEIWKDIENYEGIFMISNLERVKSLDRYIICKNGRKLHVKEKILKPIDDKNGYKVINLCYKQNIKPYKIHRLVAMHFILNPNNFNEVNHKDENKANNIVSNLEWCDRKYNVNYYIDNNKDKFIKQISNTREKYTGKKIMVYRNSNYIGEYNSVKECCNALNIDKHRVFDNIYRNVKNRNGYLFKYVELK